MQNCEQASHASRMNGQSDIAAGPLDGMTVLGDGVQALDEPEHAERREQEADAVLDQVLGHARERAMDGDPDREHQRECRAGTHRRGPRSDVLAPKLTTMNTTSSPSSSTPLNAIVKAYQSRPRRRSRDAVVRGLRLRHEGLVLVMQGEAPAAAKNRLAQPLQPERQEQHADDELQPVPRPRAG